MRLSHCAQPHAKGRLDSAGTVAALASTDIDAAFGDTQLVNLVAKGSADVIYTTKSDDPRFGRNVGTIGREAFIEAHPDCSTGKGRSAARLQQRQGERRCG